MADCIFCRIVKKEIPSKIEYEDEDVMAFHDVHPQAPLHLQVIPKRHIEKVADLAESDASLVGKLVLAAKTLARAKKVENDSFRLVFNNGAWSGQSVFHIHLHLLAGRRMGWPPG